MRKKKETMLDPLEALNKQCHIVGLKLYYEVAYHRQDKKLEVNVFHLETYRKFLGKLPTKIQGFEVEYRFAHRIGGKTTHV